MNDETRAALDAFVQRKRAFWADPPRGTCGGCGDEDVILSTLQTAPDGPPACAGCNRRAATRDHPYPCDVCGKAPAFRDPLHRKDEYLCMGCHADTGYVPGERSMVTRVMKREGAVHSQGRRDPCIAAGYGTECKGQVKPRGQKGVLCDRHNDPKRWIDNKT